MVPPQARAPSGCGRAGQAGRERVSPQTAEWMAQARVDAAARLAQARTVAAQGAARLAEGTARVAADPRLQQRSAQFVTGAAQLTAHGARFAGQAGRGTVRVGAQFWTGVGYYWRGLARLVRSPLLWLYTLLPTAIVTVLSYLAWRSVTLLTDRLAHWATRWLDDWPRTRWLLEGFAHWGVKWLVLLVLGALTAPLAMLFGALSLVLVTRRLERRLGADPGPRIPWYEATARGALAALLAALALAVGGVLFGALALVPVLGLVSPVAAVVYNGLVLGLLVMVYPLQHRGIVRPADIRRHTRGHRAAILGLGMMAALLVSIPLVQVITVPAAYLGGVLLYRRLTTTPAPPPPAPRATARLARAAPRPTAVPAGAGPASAGPGSAPGGPGPAPGGPGPVPARPAAASPTSSVRPVERRLSMTSRELDIPVADTRLHAVDAPGGDPAVLFVNGAFGTLRNWDRVVAALAGRYRAVRFDARARGRSGTSADYSLPSAVEDLARVLDGVGVQRAVLTGWSHGATVALRFAARYPDRVAGLVLVDGGYPIAMLDEAGRDKVRRQFRRLRWIMRIAAALGQSARMSPAQAADVVIEMDAANGALGPDFAALRCPTVFVVGSGPHSGATAGEMQTVRAAVSEAVAANDAVTVFATAPENHLQLLSRAADTVAAAIDGVARQGGG